MSKNVGGPHEMSKKCQKKGQKNVGGPNEMSENVKTY